MNILALCIAVFLLFLGWSIDAEERPKFKDLEEAFCKMAVDPQSYLKVPVCARPKH